jgi:hypothetical protein
MLVLGTLIAWAARIAPAPELSRRTRRLLGTAVAVLVIAAGAAGVLAATHGHPVAFARRQWNAFIHSKYNAQSSSHFGTVGSGRYDFWRVSLDALTAHPIGGLGQDNFADYYVSRRHTHEEPAWTHSLEMRLLAHTGLVGFALFATFLAAALAAVLSVRRRGEHLARVAAGVALLPGAVWLIHGSVDWFWEMPALSGPALGFLGMAVALTPVRAPPAHSGSSARARRGPSPAVSRTVAGAIAGVFALGAVVVLGFPYLSVRKVSAASTVGTRNAGAALSDLADAARLNPLSADPGRIGGTIALRAGLYQEAERRFGQSISREPDGWFAWFGRGLAASALGDAASARHDFTVAASINHQQPAIKQALTRVYSSHPLTPAEAFDLLVVAH